VAKTPMVSGNSNAHSVHFDPALRPPTRAERDLLHMDATSGLEVAASHLAKVPGIALPALCPLRPEHQTELSVSFGRGHRTEDVWRALWMAAAARAVLLPAEIASGQAVGVPPPRPGYEPLPFDYGPAHGFKPHAAHSIAAHDRGSNSGRSVADDR